jgi:hypothetical protein
MRMDQLIETTGTVVRPVDRFGGLLVKVGLPPAWEPVESPFGSHIWVWIGDPRIKDFGANAVLTMHVMESIFDGATVFPALCEQQLQMLSGGRELKRELSAATEGPGVTGLFVTQVSADVGVIESVARSRIVTTDRETLIAQLTVTALNDSPVDWSEIWLTVETGTAAGAALAGRDSGLPIEHKNKDSR